MPGTAASTSETWEFGAPPNSVEAPEKSFAREVTWAWTSSPMTTSQSPVAPRMSLADRWWTFIMGLVRWIPRCHMDYSGNSFIYYPARSDERATESDAVRPDR